MFELFGYSSTAAFHAVALPSQSHLRYSAPSRGPSSTSLPADLPRAVVLSNSEPLPPYAGVDSDLPVYSIRPVAVSDGRKPLSCYLFFLGFIFPPLWIWGALYVKYSQGTTKSRCSWIPEKPSSEVLETYPERRISEVQWGMRCTWAFMLFVCLGLCVGVTLWGSLKNRRTSEQ